MSQATAVAAMPIWKEAIAHAQERFVAIAAQDRLVDWARESMFALQAIERSDFLRSTAERNPKSLRNAIINVASCGLTLNPAAQYAALVPRDGAVCLDIMYRGLIKIATDMGSIRWVQAELVYKADTFTFNGRTAAPVHTADVFSKERGEVIGVYCVAKTVDGDILTETMSADEVNEIRDRSSSWQAFAAKKIKSSPWGSDWGEMAKKTVIKRARKTWPETTIARGSERIQTATELANHADGFEALRPDGDGVISPRSGVVEMLTDEDKTEAQQRAKAVQAKYDEAGAEEANDLIASYGMENEQHIAMWSLLQSPTRTALRKADTAKTTTRRDLDREAREHGERSA